MADDFDGFTMSHLVESSPNSASRWQLLLLMGGEEDYDLTTAELVSVEEVQKKIRASAKSIEKLEKVRITEGSEEGLACSICLDEFSIGSEAKRLPCSHVYHQNCIVQWLNNSNMCPLCSYILPPLSHKISRQNCEEVLIHGDIACILLKKSTSSGCLGNASILSDFFNPPWGLLCTEEYSSVTSFCPRICWRRVL